MAEFERTLVDKMTKMDNTQKSIQTLSLWVMHHKHKAKQSVSVWKREILSAPANKKLMYLYLANDVLQNSKKRTNAFEDAFSTVIADVIGQIWRVMSTKDQQSAGRTIEIWGSRKVFASDIMEQLKSIMDNTQKIINPIASPISVKEAAGIEISPELSAKPVFKAIQALVEIETENKPNRHAIKYNDEFLNEFKQIMDSSNDTLLETMDLSQLQELQSQYDAYMKKFSDYKNGLGKENSARKKYIAALKQEIDKQQKLQQDTDKIVKEWTKSIANLQRFQTNIEITVTNKKLLTGDSIVNDYFNEDHHQMQSNLKKRLASETDMAKTSGSNGAPFGDEFLSNKRQKLEQPSHELYEPEDFIKPPPQDVHAILDALERTQPITHVNGALPNDSIHSTTNHGIDLDFGMDNYAPSYLSEDAFPDDNTSL